VRKKEHAYAIKKQDPNNALAHHNKITAHNPNFQNTKIVFNEINLKTRLNLESWAITKPGSNALNINHRDKIMEGWHDLFL